MGNPAEDDEGMENGIGRSAGEPEGDGRWIAVAMVWGISEDIYSVGRLGSS